MFATSEHACLLRAIHVMRMQGTPAHMCGTLRLAGSHAGQLHAGRFTIEAHSPSQVGPLIS